MWPQPVAQDWRRPRLIADLVLGEPPSLGADFILLLGPAQVTGDEEDEASDTLSGPAIPVGEEFVRRSPDRGGREVLIALALPEFEPLTIAATCEQIDAVLRLPS